MDLPSRVKLFAVSHHAYTGKHQLEEHRQYILAYHPWQAMQRHGKLYNKALLAKQDASWGELRVREVPTNEIPQENLQALVAKYYPNYK